MSTRGNFADEWVQNRGEEGPRRLGVKRVVSRRVLAFLGLFLALALVMHDRLLIAPISIIDESR